MKALFSVGLSVGEAGIPKAGAYCECSPTFLLPHIRDFAQALNDGIVMHDNRSFFSPDHGYQGMKDRRQIELAAFPISGKILGALLDGAILPNEARASNSDEGRKFQALLAGRCN